MSPKIEFKSFPMVAISIDPLKAVWTESNPNFSKSLFLTLISIV
jgi:hypothetical protein